MRDFNQILKRQEEWFRINFSFSPTRLFSYIPYKEGFTKLQGCILNKRLDGRGLKTVSCKQQQREITAFFEGLWYNTDCGTDLFCSAIKGCHGETDSADGDHNKKDYGKNGLTMRIVSSE